MCGGKSLIQEESCLVESKQKIYSHLFEGNNKLMLYNVILEMLTKNTRLNLWYLKLLFTHF